MAVSAVCRHWLWPERQIQTGDWNATGWLQRPSVARPLAINSDPALKKSFYIAEHIAEMGARSVRLGCAVNRF